MRAADWDQRYAEQRQWSAEPNALVAELLAGLPPGDAVDLAAGEGRHALWLAGRGWRVTAVDFSAFGLDRGRAQPGADRVTRITADVRTWSPPPAALDLVLVAYLHLPEPDALALLTGTVGWLRPGGRLLVLGHDVENITSGIGGPQDPAILYASTGWRRWPRCSKSTGWNRCLAGRRRGRRWTPCCGGADRADPSSPAGSVPPVMGMGGTGGRDSARRRRIVAGVLVLALVLGVAATVLLLALS